jgi:hypothetical protein
MTFAAAFRFEMGASLALGSAEVDRIGFFGTVESYADLSAAGSGTCVASVQNRQLGTCALCTDELD